MSKPFLLYAHEAATPDGVVLEDIFDHPSTTRLCNDEAEIVEFLAVEDAEGAHWSWKEPDGGISMIFGSRLELDMCFPFGMQAEIDRGEGEPVRLMLRPTGRRSMRAKDFADVSAVLPSGESADAEEPGHTVPHF
jgi:hypothetical protein